MSALSQCVVLTVVNLFLGTCADANYLSQDFGALSVAWATSSVAWLVTVIVVIFILSSAVCLCNMSFEQDTLLWARPKTD